MSHRLASIVVAASLTGFAFAQTTFYVDGLRGNDLNPGTSPQQALATITAATGLAVSGDTIQVSAGVYSATSGETFPVSPAAGVDLLGADARFVIIDGDYASTTYAGHLVSLASNTTFRGFTVRNGAQGSSAWWTSAIRITDTPGVVGTTVEDCIVDTCSRGLRIGGPGNVAVDQVVVQNTFIVRCTADAISMWGDPTLPMMGQGNVLAHNTILGNSLGNVMRSAIAIADNLDVTLYGNNFYGFDFCGLEVGGAACNVQSGHDNYFLHVGSFGGTYCVDPLSTHTNTGVDTQNDPLFVDAPGGDPHLGYGSPCVDAGPPSVSGRVDFEGDPQSGTAVDQGCDERPVDYMQASCYFWPSIEAGQTSTLRVLGRPNDLAAVYYSPSLNLGGPVNLGSIGILYLDPLALSVLFGVTIPASGVSSTQIPIPTQTYFAGVDIYFQSVATDFTAFGLSELEWIQIAR